MNNHSKAERIKRWFEWIIILPIFVWFGWTIYDQRTLVFEQIAAIHFDIAALSLALLAAIFLLEADVWRDLFAEAGYAFSFRDAVEIIYISSMGRYVPGRIWQFSSAVYLLHNLNVPTEIAAALSILSQLLSVVAGTLLALPVLFWWIASLGSDWLLILSIILVTMALGLATLFPSMWLRVLNWAVRLVGRPNVPELLPVNRMVWYTIRYLVIWSGLGVGFFVLARAIYPLDWTSLPITASTFAFAYIVGYLVIFVPGGLGVREGAMGVALSMFLPVAVAASLAILARVWLSLGEFGFAAIAVWLRSRRPRGYFQKTGD